MSLKKILILLLFIITQLSVTIVSKAQNKQPSVTDGEVVITEHPANKDATFKSGDSVIYNIDLKNTYTALQTGKISYKVFTPDGNLVTQKSIPVSLAASGSKTVHVAIPSQKAGFYKVNFMLNVTDYDDTVKRVFGVDIYNVRSPYPKPADFDSFWNNTKAELAKVSPNFRITERRDQETGNDRIFLIEMQSLDNITVRGWMTIPKDLKAGEKLPVYMVLPGFMVDVKPFHNTGSSFAFIGLNIRGNGNSRDVVSPTREQYPTYNVEDKNKYIYRGALMDCVRMIDFISSRPELDSKSIFVNGGSLGGYLSLALAGLDHRISIAEADNPIYSDYRLMMNNNIFPAEEIKRYAKVHALSLPALIDNLDYFDLKNFATNIHCNTITGIGLLDNLAPPSNVLAMYNNIPGNKQLFIYPNLSHEVDTSLGNYKGKFVYDKFGIAEKQLARYKVSNAAVASNIQQPPTERRTMGGNMINIEDAPFIKNAVFGKFDQVVYDINLKSNFKIPQSGKLLYHVTSEEGKPIVKDSFPISFTPMGTKQVHVEVPQQSSGFYKINFITRTENCNDSITTAFGVGPEAISALPSRPKDFDSFWETNKKELASVEAGFTMVEQREMAKRGNKVYKLQMKSLDNVTISAWLTVPLERIPGKLGVVLVLPNFQQIKMDPVYGSYEDMAYISFSVRGQGSKSLSDPFSLTNHIEDKNKYNMRGVVMDCIRMVDFIFSKPNLFDKRDVLVSGGNLGGYLALTLAALDPRVKYISVKNPVMCNIRNLATSTDWPDNYLKEYMRLNPQVKMDEVLKTLDYFDANNFAGDVHAETLMGIGLLDPTAPPNDSYAVYNNIASKNKKIFVYKDLVHDVGPDYQVYEMHWFRDLAALF